MLCKTCINKLQNRQNFFVKLVKSLSSNMAKVGGSNEALDMKPVIGLEIHAQLQSQTKLFSGSLASTTTDFPTNTQVSLFDLAIPGTLPRLNQKSVENFETYKKQVKIQRIQLEMDSGKTVSMGLKEYIDFNRVGISLTEIVTEPELESPLEAFCFAEQIRLLMMHNRICSGEMHRGHMRIDANVSFLVNGQKYSKVEIKNLNGLKFLQTAIYKELEIQKNSILKNEEILEETKTLDDNMRLISMREKGDSLDYRFTPEPNLPRLHIQDEWVLKAKENIRRDVAYFKYIENYGFSPNFSLLIMSETGMEAFFNELLSHFTIRIPYEKINGLFYEYKRIAEALKSEFPSKNPLVIQRLAEVIQLESQGLITRLLLVDLFKEIVAEKDLDITAKEQVERRNQWRFSADEQELQNILDNFFKDKSVQKMIEKVKKIKQVPGGRNNKHFNKVRNALIDLTRKRLDVTEIENYVLKEIQNKNVVK